MTAGVRNTGFSVVHSTGTLAELRRIEVAHEAPTLRTRLSCLGISAWLMIANSFLGMVKRAAFRANPPVGLRSVAVYAVGTLGDNLLLLPAIAAIRRAYPSARLTVLVNCDGYSTHAAEEIYSNSPDVDEVITLSNHPLQRRGWKLVVTAPAGLRGRFDLFVNLSPFGNRGWMGAVLRELLFARWLGARRAVGFRVATYSRRHYFNHVQHRFVVNEPRRPRRVLRELGLVPLEREQLLPARPDLAARLRIRIGAGCSGDRPLVVLNPGAKLGASRWPAERYGELAGRLVTEHGAVVVVNATAEEQRLADQVVSASGGLAISLAGELSILELVELLRVADLCITNNTGTMHVAAMLEVPLVVTASTRFSPSFYFPLSRRQRWLFSFAENSYSYDDACRPVDLENIPVSSVLAEAVSLLPPLRHSAWEPEIPAVHR